MAKSSDSKGKKTTAARKGRGQKPSATKSFKKHGKKTATASVRGARTESAKAKATGAGVRRSASKGSVKAASKKRVTASAKTQSARKAKKPPRASGAKRPKASAKKPAVSRKTPAVAAKKSSGAGKKHSEPKKRKRLEDIDRDLSDRIHELKQEIAELGGEIFFESGEELPGELEEAFLESVLEVESAGWTKPFDLLVESGIALPAPHELAEAELEGKLWEVINALALVSVFLERTDHLSDRELYAHLWNESLREELIIIPNNPGFQSHIDVIGSGSDEDTAIWLRYYADDEDRMDWAEQFPDFPIPEREQPAYDRDSRLPRPGGEHQPGVH